LFYVKV